MGGWYVNDISGHRLLVWKLSCECLICLDMLHGKFYTSIITLSSRSAQIECFTAELFQDRNLFVFPWFWVPGLLVV